jgi:hypothetical protein
VGSRYFWEGGVNGGDEDEAIGLTGFIYKGNRMMKPLVIA